MKLSNNFTLGELTKSSTAERSGIDNTPSDEEVHALRQVAIMILQPVREYYGVPFIPNSGFRCIKLNRAIGSKDTSQHTKGQAVDFEIPGIGNYDLAGWIKDNLDFDQLILECYKPGEPSSGWVHCSYVSKEDNRHKALTYDGKKYLNGLLL